jgi:arabinofuranan 3-O-arabinosyltransferase
VVAIRSWQPDQGQLSIGRGVASYVEVHENYNPGWAASLNGQALTPVRLDGWQQGFVVPAGAGGAITLTFRPTATYHLALIASLLAAAILLALTAWSFLAAGQGGATMMGAGGERRGRRRAWIGVVGVTALILVAGGVVALVVPVLAWLAGRVRLPVLAFGAMVASGLLAAVRPFGTGLLGPFGWPAQACALVALAAALIAGSVGAARSAEVPGTAEAPGTFEVPRTAGPSGEDT